MRLLCILNIFHLSDPGDQIDVLLNMTVVSPSLDIDIHTIVNLLDYMQKDFSTIPPPPFLSYFEPTMTDSFIGKRLHFKIVHFKIRFYSN